MLYWTGVVLGVLGVLVFVVGFWLNNNSPIQQPLPIVGLVMFVVGAVLFFLPV